MCGDCGGAGRWEDIGDNGGMNDDRRKWGSEHTRQCTDDIL